MHCAERKHLNDSEDKHKIDISMEYIFSLFTILYIYTVNPLIVAGAFIYLAAKSPRPLL